MLALVAIAARNRIGEIAFTGIITALIAVAAWAAYVNIEKYGWSGDSAAWAQAAGSIIAIAGASWIARGEARQARRLRRRQGEEAAWAVRFTLAQA
ncbi:hypothetical protein [uncultured Caulobacter sp.]|uniref:hypothetical protein n=1 Tax=uncultured Caulobacter sp. TaxID=158749 RepID=UPI0026191D05|nr:hypothetical protein [uncultured Caulobacter sp.]